MKRMRTVADSDSATSESDVENSYNTDNEVETDSVSKSDSDNVDDTSSEVGNGYESDSWAPLKAKATQQSLSEFEELTKNFSAEDSDENEAKDKAYLLIQPKLFKDLQNVYLERLLWIRQLKRDPIHKKIMETRDVFVNDDNFDHREALEAAIDKRKFILKRLFRNTWSPNNIDRFKTLIDLQMYTRFTCLHC
jgi:hypothetical protein